MLGEYILHTHTHTHPHTYTHLQSCCDMTRECHLSIPPTSYPLISIHTIHFKRIYYIRSFRILLAQRNTQANGIYYMQIMTDDPSLYGL